MVNQSRQLTSTNNEFSGSTQNYRDWKISVTSQLSTISSAYKLQMAENPQLISFDSIRPWLPIWIFPEHVPLGDDHPPDVLQFYESADDLCTQMIDRINADVTSRIYWHLVSTLKGEPRHMIIERTQNAEDQTPQNILQLLNERYDKLDLTRAMGLQRELFNLRVEQGANIAKVINSFLAKLSKLRFDLTNLGYVFPDASIT